MAKNVLIKKYGLKIDNKEYTFILDMKAALKCEDKFGNFSEIYNGVILGKKFYTNVFKMLSCACVEKDWDYMELAEKLSMNFYELKKFDQMALDMLEGFELFDKDKKSDDEKNEKTSQNLTK